MPVIPSAELTPSRLRTRTVLLSLGGLLAVAVALPLFVKVAQGHFALALGSLAAFSISLLMMHAWVRLFDFRRLTIPGFWYLSYVSILVVPSFYIYGRESGPFRGNFLFAVHTVLITAPVGMWIANLVLRYRFDETVSYYEQPITPERDGYLVWSAIGCLCVSLLLTANYLREAGTIPIFYLLANPGSAEMLSVLREESLKLLNSPLVYWYAVWRQVIYPLLIVVALGMALLTRRRSWYLLFCFSLLSGLGFAAFTGAKMPVAAIILLIVLMYYLFNRGKVSRLQLFSAGGALFLGYPVLMQALALYGKDFGPFDFVLQVLARIFEAPAEVLYTYFEIVPAYVPHLYGRSSHFFATLTGSSYFDLENYAAQYLFGPESTGTASAPFIGNLWGDFALPGVLFGGVVAGFLMQFTHVLLVRRKKTILNLALYTFLIWTFAQITIAPMPYVLYSGGAVFGIVFVAAIAAIDKVLTYVSHSLSTVRLRTP